MMDRWVDLAEAAILNRLAELRDIEAFRESLPFGRTPFSEPDSAMRESYEQLVKALLSDLDLEVGYGLMRRKMVSYAAPSFRGRFLDLERVKTLAPECVAFVRKDAIVSLSEDGDGATLALVRRGRCFRPGSCRRSGASPRLGIFVRATCLAG